MTCKYAPQISPGADNQTISGELSNSLKKYLLYIKQIYFILMKNIHVFLPKYI